MPSPGQQPINFPPQNQQPVIRPPLVPNVRPLINPQQQPIRNLPPQQGQQVPQVRPPVNPQQFRPPPSQQQQQSQQGFPPRQPYAPPQPDQQQYRPQVPLQRQPEPQKIIRPSLPPQQQQQSGGNMMAEINREKTFTTNNNSEQSIDDDDDDVVVGRMNTPQNRNGQKPVESFAKENVQQQQPQVRAVPPPIDTRRRESVQSIPSRPPSGLGSNNSASPEPRSPGLQQQFNSNNNRPEQINRNDMSRGDYMRDTNDYERVQRPMPPPQQRQSPEDMNRPKVPQQPIQMPPQKPPVSAVHQQPTIQDHLPFMKPNLMSPEPPQQKQQQNVVQPPPPVQEMRKPPPMQNVKKHVDLDLGKPMDPQSVKNRPPPSKNVHMCT